MMQGVMMIDKYGATRALFNEWRKQSEEFMKMKLEPLKFDIGKEGGDKQVLNHTLQRLKR